MLEGVDVRTGEDFFSVVGREKPDSVSNGNGSVGKEDDKRKEAE
jgi:hypothetical protein